jgi:hypothetical protein
LWKFLSTGSCSEEAAAESIVYWLQVERSVVPVALLLAYLT